MGIIKTLGIAVRALAKNKMRAGLTVLGVVIGIAAVTTMVSIGQSAGALVRGELENFGTNVIIIHPAEQKRGGVRRGRVNTLTSKDAAAIAEECRSVLAVSPMVGTAGQVVYGNLNINPNEMFGVGHDYLQIRNWPIRYGAFFDKIQIDKAEKVCVVGRTVVTKLFQTSDPINEKIRVNNKPFTIIGVLETKGANMVGQDQDSTILMPYTTVRRTLNGSSFDDVNVIVASAVASEKMSTASDEIRQVLMDRHSTTNVKEADFEVQTTTEIANMLGMITGTMTLLLASIAGISLLVGGVGIMNIMLVSVTERTREIGIRMAVGAPIARYPDAVSGRVSVAFVYRWTDRICAGYRRLDRNYEADQFVLDGYGMAGHRFLSGSHCRILICRGGRCIFWFLPRAKGQQAGSYRSPAI